MRLRTIAGLLTLLLLAGCTDETNYEEVEVEEQMAEAPQQNLVEMIQDNEQFEQLAQLLQQAGLVESLQQAGPFTVFAPTDAAFEKMDDTALRGLMQDTTRLRTILAYHVVPELLLADQVPELESVQTLAGDDLQFGATERGAQVNGAAIVAPNMRASNGVIHAVDEVLMPTPGQGEGF